MAFMMQYSSLLRSLAAGSAFLFLLVPAALAAEQTVETPSVDARAWILMSYASGKVLAEGNADEKLDPASLTRVTTSYVVGQTFKADKTKPTGMVTVGKDTQVARNPVLRGSSVMFLRPGDQVSVAGLDKGVIIQSGDDVCIVLADHVAGNQEPFIGLMNDYAKKLGLTNTTFQAVHDLDASGQLSTVRNMVSLGKALIHDVPEECAIHKEKEFTFNKIRQPNCNRLLWSNNLDVDGTKTGTTAGAEYNLVVSVTQGDMRLISVVLGAETDHICFNESGRLLIWGPHFLETVTPIKPGTAFVTQRVRLSDENEVNSGAGGAGSAIISRGQLRNLKVGYTLMGPQLTVPLKEGQVVGTIDFQLNGKSTEQRPLIVMEDVEKGGFFGRMWDFVMIKFHQWFGSWSPQSSDNQIA